MPKPRKKRSLAGTEDKSEKQDATLDCSQRLDQDSDMPKSELSTSETPAAKRAKVGKFKERQYDKYCWSCHFEDCSEKCSFCPRVYHTSCVPRIEMIGGDWTCPECQAVLMAEKNRTTSPIMSLLSTDQLCNLLKYSLNRMEMHVPKDFCFGSLSSVFYPMDFSLLEKNIRKKAYSSPAAFLADAKWIFHNHVVYFPIGVPAVKTIMKVCQEEMREIDTCPDCYLHAYSMKDKWFSEPCRKPHTLVWAKLKGFPIWPAKAVKTLNGNVDVRFFGGHERAWVPATHCYFFSRDPPQAISSQKKNFECAHQEVELHIKLLSQRFGGFEYAPEKTPFNPSQIYLYLNVTLSKLSYLPQSLRDKRKQEITPTPAKRRISRAQSAQEVQGNKKDEKKEINVSQPYEEKDGNEKAIDCYSQEDTSASLPLLIAKSDDENCANNDVVIQLQENTNSKKDSVSVLPEKTCKDEIDNNSQTEKVNGDEISNLVTLQLENNFKEQTNSINHSQNGSRIELSTNIETSALEETDIVKNADQENTVLEPENFCVENKLCTESSDQEQSSSIHCSPSATNTSKDNQPGIASGINEVSSNISVSQLKQDSTEMLTNNNEHYVDVPSEDLNYSNSMPVAKELDQDFEKLPTNTLCHIDKNGADLGAGSELIIDMVSTENEDNGKDIAPFIDMVSTENEDNGKDIAPFNNKNTTVGNKNCDIENPCDRKDAKKRFESEEKQGNMQVNIVSSKQSNQLSCQARNIEFSQEIDSIGDNSTLPTNGTLLQNIKEVVVIKSLQTDNKITKENNDVLDSVTPASSSSTLENLTEVLPVNKNSTQDDKIEEIDKSSVACAKGDISDPKLESLTDNSAKSETSRSSVYKKDKHSEDLLTADNKVFEKNEEFHVDDSHLDKNSSSNSLRIRIVKGKVESENPCSVATLDIATPCNKDSKNACHAISKTAKIIEIGVVNAPKDDLVQNITDTKSKILIQQPEQVSGNADKQGSVVISKRPRKNFIIHIPQKQQNDIHSNQDNRNLSTAVVSQEDCQTNSEISHHPDEPDIIKNFKATFEKIHKVKYSKGSVLEKVIDYKSYNTNLNEVQKVKSILKPSTNLTNSPVVIKVPTINLSENNTNLSKTSSTDCVPSSTKTNQLSQIPVSKISNAKSLQIIAIDSRGNCSNSNTIKHSDLSQLCNISHKQTEISHCSNLNSECINNSGETSATKILNIKDQSGAEIKIQDKCSDVNILLQNVQTSLKDNTTLSHETSTTNIRSQTNAENLHPPSCDREKNLFNILPVEKYARKLTVFLTNTLEEMCQDIINSGCMQVAMQSLESEVISLREKHKKDLTDVKQNAELVLKEMRSTMETEKQNAVAEVRRQCEMEMRKNVEEAKKKQWCANCGKEAVFYCCWNTSYCDYPCQQTHWPQHMTVCGQNHVPPVKEQQIIRMPNLGPDMTITQSPPGLPLEIQLTTHSPTQTNKNKKKLPSSSDKIAVAPRSKGRTVLQPPSASLQPHDITRSSHVIYSPHYRLQGGQVIPLVLSHNNPHQQQCGPNAMMENKSHNVQHTVPFPYNPHVCM